MSSVLLSPIRLGALDLANRVVMAPLTRMRADEDGTPSKLAVEYYSQRATAGLIITEATQISLMGRGYPATPGIHTQAHVDAWKNIVDNVHNKGGKIVMQLWHVGRIAHVSNLPAGRLPLAPSALAARGLTFANDWSTHPYSQPQAMDQSDIDSTLADYEQAARNAMAAGFDGVEVHAANGYLIDQFLQDKTNTRTDEYGGSFDNRIRLLLAVLDRVSRVYSFDRVGVRLSPFSHFNDIGDSQPQSLFAFVLGRLSHYGLAYVHLIEPRACKVSAVEGVRADAPGAGQLFRPHYVGALIVAGGFSQATAEAAVESGQADAVAFGRYFISNPDLVYRFANAIPLTPYERRTFYGGGRRGYTDYEQAKIKEEEKVLEHELEDEQQLVE